MGMKRKLITLISREYFALQMHRRRYVKRLLMPHPELILRFSVSNTSPKKGETQVKRYSFFTVAEVANYSLG